MNQDIINKFIEFAKNRKYINRAWLYGSRIKGKHKPESDFDIAIEIKGNHTDETDFSFWFFNNEKLNKELKDFLGINAHLEHYKRGSHVKKFVDKDGILIYSRLAHKTYSGYYSLILDV